MTLASSSTHLTAANVCDNNIINQDVAVTPSTSLLTFPTAASIISSCLTQTGDYRTVLFKNTSNETDEFVTLTANTGDDFSYASTSATAADTTANLHAEGSALVRFTNLNEASVSVDIIQFQEH